MEYVIELPEDKHELIKMAAAAGVGDWVYRIVAKGKPLKQEPKTGHWEYGYSFADGNYCKCSECKEIIKCTYPMHYCPNCGAKMIEPQESEVNNG